jgi:CHAT domain-containing protein/tetratricopeptide (TPR) repeat protein
VTPVLQVLVAMVLALSAQQPTAGRASAPPDWIVTYPERARDSIRTWMAASVSSAPRGADALLARAERLGADYLTVWGDSFPLRDVRRFMGLSPDQRVRRIRADSLRRSGNAKLGREGFAAAVTDWRASRALAAASADTAGMAAATGNIGAGFYHESALDSAARYFTKARSLAQLVGDRRTDLNALGGLASVSKDRGDYAAAARQYREALFLRRQVGDYRGVAADADNLGLVAAATGQPAEAQRRYVEALVTAREHGFEDAAAAALLNLGVLASSEGEDRVAEQRYGEALALYRKLDDPSDEALALRNLGLVTAGRGSYPEAAARYQEALTILARTGPVETAVATRVDLSQVFAAMGNLDRADRELLDAELAARDGHLLPGTLGRLRLSRGDLALAFNHLGSARSSYEAGLAVLRKAKDVSGEADALAALGGLSLVEEQYDEARRLLTSAAVQHQSKGDRRSAALATLLAARAAWKGGDTAVARALLAQTIDSLHAAGDQVSLAQALCESGTQLMTAGSLQAAETAYRAGLARLGRTPALEASTCLYGGLGRTLRARGATREAVAELRHGVIQIEAAAASVGVPGRRADFLSDKWALYTDLAVAQMAMGETAAAFETSERLRVRQSLSLGGRDPEYPRLAALSRRITDLLEGATGPATVTTLREAADPNDLNAQGRVELAQAETEYATLLDSLEVRSAVDSSPPVRVPGWRRVAARLPADAALIEYLVADSSTLAFVVTSERLSAVDLPLSHTELATDVDFIRGVLTPKTRGGARWEAPLIGLRAQLVTPLEHAGLLRGKSRLLIVPHRELHYLPFAALREPGPSGRFLVQRYEIATVASGAAWLEILERPTPSTTNSLLALAPRPGDLPGSRAEIRAIADLYGTDAEVVLGKRATREAFAAAAPEHSILHLASRGVLNRYNPRFSYIELAPGGRTEGRLELYDVARLSLHARLVVLSACQTGLSSGRLADVPAGGDWVGLVQAFESAGARRVLATLWAVDDQATAQLMKRFYTALRAGETESGALAVAQRGALAAEGTRPPFYWAAFVIDGDL